MDNSFIGKILYNFFKNTVFYDFFLFKLRHKSIFFARFD